MVFTWLSVSGYPPAYFDTTPRARAALHRSNKTRVVMAERGAHLPGPVVGATFAARKCIPIRALPH